MRSRTFQTICLLGLLAVGYQPVFGDDTVDDVEKPEQIEQFKPPFYVRATLNKPNGIYHARDFVSIKAISEKTAYLYIMYTQADGKVYQIFPNSVHKKNFVKAKEEVELGARSDLFRWVVSKPFGKETVSVIASVEPIKDLSKREMIARQFNPVSAKQLKGVTTVLAESIWSCTHVPMETREKAPEPEKPPARRVGLFVGVGKHMFDPELIELIKKNKPAEENVRGNDYVGPEHGAETLKQMLQPNGGLDEFRVLTQEKATRANIQDAITRWLPECSRPGDTVFIFYGGHTGQYDDDNGDERDGKDEVITTHDFGVNLGVLGLAKLRIDKGDQKVPLAKRRVVERVFTTIGKANLGRLPGLRGLSNYDRGWRIAVEASRKNDKRLLKQINQMIIRETGISDDVMGRWIQKLEGRRVVMILDTCHSGGHATNEKSFFAAPNPLDFLDSEVTRLKDLGQRDLALLSACLAKEVSYAVTFPPALKLPRMGLFTGGIVLTLREKPGRLPVEQVFELAKEKVAELVPDAKQTAVIFNDLTETVYFKPER